MEYGCKSYLNNLWCFLLSYPYRVMWNLALCCSSSCYSLNVHQRCVRKSDCIRPSLYTVRNLEKVFSSESGPNGASIMDITYHVNWITALRIIIYSELRALRLSSRYYVLHTRYHCLLYQEYLLNPWLVSCIFAGREVRHLTYLNFTFQCQICMHHVSGLMTVDVCVHHLFGSSLDGRRAFLGEHIDE